MRDRRKAVVRKLRIVCVYIAIVVAFAAVWLKIAEAPVVYQAQPHAALPHPNAYDTYLMAARSLVDIKQIEDALSSKPPISRSSKPSTPIQKSFSLPSYLPPGYFNQNTKKPPSPDGVPAISSHIRSCSLAEKRAIINANRKALNIFREGLKQECIQSLDANKDFPNLVMIRKLSSAVTLEAVVYKESGDNGKAIMACLDGLQMGNDIARGGYLLTGLVSLTMQSMLREDAWGMIDSLNSAETRKAITRLNGIIAETVPYKSVMLEESRFDLLQSKELLNAQDWREQLVSQGSQENLFSDELPTWRDNLRGVLKYAKTLGMSRRGLFAGLQNDYSEYLAATELSYADSNRLNIPESNILSQWLIPIFGKARFKFEYNRCMNDLFLLQLALHVYRLEHGVYPVKLIDLAPGYIKNVPMDPFGSSDDVYKYNLTSKGYTLYSVGPDLNDDGGHAVIRRGKPNSRLVNYDDTGDIVAGYNR